jgi:hypothetical protein
MDFAKLQRKIYVGYGKAAQRIGPPNTIYRATGAFTPMGSNIITLPVSYNAEDMKYGRPNKYGKPTWFGLFDGTLAHVGDYLVGQQGTFFIAEMQLTLPILVVECNRTINFLRSPASNDVGALGYNGTTTQNEVPLMTGWPASVLQGTKGEKGDAVLPGDARSPWWSILVPYCAGVVLRTSDIGTDDLNRRYTVSSAELTDAGWRITAMQAVT